MKNLYLTTAFFLASLTSWAAHPFLCTDSYGGKVAVVSSEGAVEWEYRCEHPQDCWMLANGNILFCHKSGALELTRSKEVVWEYRAPSGTEVHGCQPLADGNILVVQCGASSLVEVDRAGHVAKTITLTPPPPEISIHDQYRGARKTSDGHYWVCRKGEHRVDELSPDGTVLQQIPVPGDVHEAILLANGHLLVSCGDGHKIVELDQRQKVVHQLNENDIPGNPLRLMAGMQRLPNGNTIYCNYLGHGHLGEQPQFFELTPDHQVVWSFADHDHFKSINQIQVLDVPGDPAKGEIFR